MKWLKRLTDKFKKSEPEVVPKPEEPKEPKEPKEPVKIDRRKFNKGNPAFAVLNKGRTISPLKLSQTQKRQVISLIATLRKEGEIIEYAKNEWGITLSPQCIVQYRKAPKWKPIIQAERAAYLQMLEDTPGYFEQVRMKRYDDIHDISKKEGDSRTALAASEAQSKEVKSSNKYGEPINFVFQQFNNMSDEELKDKYNRAMEIVERYKVKSVNQYTEVKNGNGGIEIEAGK